MNKLLTALIAVATVGLFNASTFAADAYVTPATDKVVVTTHKTVHHTKHHVRHAKRHIKHHAHRVHHAAHDAAHDAGNAMAK